MAFNLSANLNIQNVNTRQAEAALNKVGKAAEKTTRIAERLADALDLKTKSFVAYAIVSSAVIKLSNVIAGATRDAIRFESELARIAQTSEINVKDMKALNKELLQISKQYGVSVNKIAETVRVLNQAGVSFRDATLAAKALAKTTLLASFENYTETVDGVIAAMKQFGVEARNLEAFLGSINQVSKRYAVESTDLIETIKKAGGVFATTGGNVEELLALFTSVRGTTRESADTIATGLRTIFSRLQRPKTIEYFKELGIQLQDSRKNFIGNFEAIQAISRGLDRLGIKAGSVRFAEVVEEIGGIRQSSRVIPLLTQTTTQLEALRIAKEGNKSIDEDIAKQQKTLEFRLEQLSKEFTALIVNFSDSEGFKTFARFMIEAARAAVKLTEALAPLAPLVTALAGFEGARLFKRYTFGPKSPFKFASGGKVPGVGNSDSELAMLTPGEFVINKKSAQAYGYDNLQGINKYAKGGIVGGIKRFFGFGEPSISPPNASPVNPSTAIDSQAKADAEIQRLIKNLGKAGEALKDVSVNVRELTNKDTKKANVPAGSQLEGLFTPGNSKRKSSIDLDPRYASKSTLRHEAGHTIDLSLGGGKNYASETEGTFQNSVVEKERQRLEKELRDSGASEDYIRYATEGKEIFAEMFAKANAKLRKILVSTTDVEEGQKQLDKYYKSVSPEALEKKRARREANQEFGTDRRETEAQDAMVDKAIEDLMNSRTPQKATSVGAKGQGSRLSELQSQRDAILNSEGFKKNPERSDIKKKLANLDKEIEREKEREVAGVKSVAPTIKQEAEVRKEAVQAIEENNKAKETETTTVKDNSRTTRKSLKSFPAIPTNSKYMTDKQIQKSQEDSARALSEGQKTVIDSQSQQTKPFYPMIPYQFNKSKVVERPDRTPSRYRFYDRSESGRGLGGERQKRIGTYDELEFIEDKKQRSRKCIPVEICNVDEIKCRGESSGSKKADKTSTNLEESEKQQTNAVNKNTLSLIELLGTMSLLSFGISAFANSFDQFSEDLKTNLQNFSTELIRNTANIGFGASVGSKVGERVQGISASISQRKNSSVSGSSRLASGYNLSNFALANNKQNTGLTPGNPLAIKRQQQFGNIGKSIQSSFNKDSSTINDAAETFALAAGTMLTVTKTIFDTGRRSKLDQVDKDKNKAIEDGNVKAAVEAAKTQAELQERSAKDAIAGPILSGIGAALGTALSPILGPLGPELGAALGNFLSQFEIIQDVIVGAIDVLIAGFNNLSSFFGSDPFPTLTESFEKAKENAILQAKSQALFNRAVKTFDKATDSFRSKVKLGDAVGGNAGKGLRANAVNEALAAIDKLLSESNQIPNDQEAKKNFEDKFTEALAFGSEAIIEQAKIYTEEGQSVEQALSTLGASFDENNSILTNSKGAVGRYISALKASGKTQQEVDSALQSLSASIIEVSKEVDGLAEATAKMSEMNEARAESELEKIKIETERRSSSINRDATLSEASSASSRLGSTQNLLGSISGLGALRANAAANFAKDDSQTNKANLADLDSEFKILTERTKAYISAKEEELNIVKRSSDQFYSFLDTLTYGTNQEKRNIDANLKLAKVAASQGLDAIAPSKRGDVQKTLEQFADLPIFNGKTGNQVRGDFAVKEARRLNGGRLTTEQERQIRNRSSSPQERIANEIADLKTALVNSEQQKLIAEYEALTKHDEAFGAAVQKFGETTTNFEAALALQQQAAGQREAQKLDAQIAGEEDKKRRAKELDKEDAQLKLDNLKEQGFGDANARNKLFDALGLSPNQKKFFESKLTPKDQLKGAEVESGISGGLIGSLIGGGVFGGEISSKIKEKYAPKKMTKEEYDKIINEAIKMSDDPTRNLRTNPSLKENDARINDLKSKRERMRSNIPQGDGQNLSVDTNFGTIPVNVAITAPEMGVLSDMITSKVLSAVSEKFGQMAEKQAFGVS